MNEKEKALKRLLELDNELVEYDKSFKLMKLYKQINRYSKIPSMKQKVDKLIYKIIQLKDEKLKSQLNERNELVKILENEEVLV